MKRLLKKRLYDSFHSLVWQDLEEDWSGGDFVGHVNQCIDECFEFYDEYSPEEIADAVPAVVKKIMKEYLAVEKTWIKPTCNDWLDFSFNALEQKGIMARQNYTCCNNCGHKAIDDELFAMSGEEQINIKGFVFYHVQERDEAINNKSLYLNFGTLCDSFTTRAIGKIIVKELQKNGFKVVWNGRADKKIVIVDFDWKKRRLSASPLIANLPAISA